MGYTSRLYVFSPSHTPDWDAPERQTQPETATRQLTVLSTRCSPPPPSLLIPPPPIPPHKRIMQSPDAHSTNVHSVLTSLVPSVVCKNSYCMLFEQTMLSATFH